MCSLSALVKRVYKKSVQKLTVDIKSVKIVGSSIKRRLCESRPIPERGTSESFFFNVLPPWCGKVM